MSMITIADPFVGDIYEGNSIVPRHENVVVVALNKGVNPRMREEFFGLVVNRQYPPHQHSFIFITDDTFVQELKDLVGHVIDDAYYICRDTSLNHFGPNIKCGAFVLDRFIPADNTYQYVFLDTDVWVQNNMFDLITDDIGALGNFKVCREQHPLRFSDNLWDNISVKDHSIYSSVLQQVGQILDEHPLIVDHPKHYFPLVNTGVMMFNYSGIEELHMKLVQLFPIRDIMQFRVFSFMEQLHVNIALACMANNVSFMNPLFNWQLFNRMNDVYYDPEHRCFINFQEKRIPNLHFNGFWGRKRYAGLQPLFENL